MSDIIAAAKNVCDEKTEWFSSNTSAKITPVLYGFMGLQMVTATWNNAIATVTPLVCQNYVVDVVDNEGNPHKLEISSEMPMGTVRAKNFPYSPASRTYTVRNGSRGKPRMFIDFDVMKWLRSNTDTKKAVDVANNAAKCEYWAKVMVAYDKLARAALAEIPNIDDVIALNDALKTMTAAEKREWFVSREFSNVPSVEIFEKMTSLLYISVEAGPDGFGHECGTMIDINYATKNFTTPYGWSSDD